MRLERRILVVEDEPELWRNDFEKVFSEPDWKVSFAVTVDEAKQTFGDYTDFDLLIVDYALGDGTGRDFLKFARSIDKNIPAFLFSGYTDSKKDGFHAKDIQAYNTISYFIDKDKVRDQPETLYKIIKEEYDGYMANMCTPNVCNEFGTLRTVMVHTPSEEMERIDPDHLGYYLFESRPELGLMQQQHTTFIKKLKENAERPIVLEIGLLLYDVLKSAKSEQRQEIVENILFGHEFRTMTKRCNRHRLKISHLMSRKVDDICACDPRRITLDLLCGLNVADFPQKKKVDASMLTRWDCQIISPVANLYCMRDPAFVTGEFLVLSRMYWAVRQRESSIIHEIVKYHPFMKNARSKLIDWQLYSGEPFFIEGGDVMVIGNGDYVIAESERTNRQAVIKLADRLLRSGQVKRIFQPIIPVRRSFIHLDTVCSLVGPNYAIAYPEAIEAHADTLYWTQDNMSHGEFIPKSLGKNFVRTLEEECGKKIIKTAGGSHRARLEQFDDATNIFMIGPETVLTYDRNIDTNIILKAKIPNVVEFSGSDLVMGRGGARCMTMPLRRG